MASITVICPHCDKRTEVGFEVGSESSTSITNSTISCRHCSKMMAVSGSWRGAFPTGLISVARA